jgi:lipid-binding SYLF domain-containing protein
MLRHMNVARFAVAGVVAAGLCLQPLVAADKTEESERISKAIEVVGDLVKTPDEAIPEYILERAEAIVVIPTLVKGGLVVGAEHGKGVMSARDAAAARGWTAPSFVTMTGGSIGWQIGLQSVDLVLLVMNRDGIDDLLSSEFKLGANTSVAAGPVGRSAQAATGAKMTAKILAYSRAKGLFAGATIEGATLRDDPDANQRFYGKALSAKELFAGAPPTGVPPLVTSWRAALQRAATPERSQ